MTNRPKAIGTAGESGIVKYLRDRRAFPENRARRVTLAGRYDLGDVHAEFPDGTTYAIEVKSGAMAKTASLNQIADWQAEAFTEARHAKAEPMLVIQRSGYAPSRAQSWRAFILIDGPSHDDDYWIEMPLARCLSYVADMHGRYAPDEEAA